MEPSVNPDLPILWHSIGSPYGSLCIGFNDLASWAQTLMPLHPVEAHFHTAEAHPEANQRDDDGG